MPVDTEKLADLRKDTPKEEIKQRTLSAKAGGKTLDYVDARYVQDTLDEVVGPANWQSQFESSDIGGVRCGIGILIEQPGEMGGPIWVWKWDAGIESTIEPVKGAHSDAFKRAAVQWGIARDLYDTRAEESEAAPSTVRSRMGSSPTPEPSIPISLEDAPWACPVHDAVKIVGPGTVKNSNPPRTYPAFYACPMKNEDGTFCVEKGPKVEQPLPFGAN